MRKNNQKKLHIQAGTAVLSVLAFLAFSALLPVPAQARPCCEECLGWPEPPPFPDTCWRNCYICGGGGPLAGLTSEFDPSSSDVFGDMSVAGPGELRLDRPAAGCAALEAASGSGNPCYCWPEEESEAACEAYCAAHGLGYCQASLPMYPGSCTSSNKCKMRVVNECYDNGVRTQFFFYTYVENCESCTFAPET